MSKEKEYRESSYKYLLNRGVSIRTVIRYKLTDFILQMNGIDLNPLFPTAMSPHNAERIANEFIEKCINTYDLLHYVLENETGNIIREYYAYRLKCVMTEEKPISDVTFIDNINIQETPKFYGNRNEKRKRRNRDCST